MNTVRTTCPYCGVGCGVIAQRDAHGAVTVRGDARHPANVGRLCVKGAALGETTGLAGRLLYPEINGERACWDNALDEAGARLRAIIDQHGPQAVAFYASGQLLTEDYYAANKLMKGFIGAANIDTNSRLCMSSAVVGYKRAFGADAVPCSYEDIEQTDLLILVGSNAAWAHPVLYQRIAAAKQARPEMKVVVIDPRRTATCDIADAHLALAPGSDAGLFVGLLNRLAHKQGDRFDGEEAAYAAARDWPVGRVAAFCGLAAEELERFYDDFLSAPRVMTLYTMGVNQSSSGSDKCNAIINVHLASGKIGLPGCGPFSLTGQPNAMGGREVGGLANQLACHMGFEPADIARLGRFWGSERIAQTPGLMAVELFDAIGRGEVKALWVMGTNPAVSLPDSDRVKAALAACPLVIVSEVAAQTDTSRYAHIRFPALAWGEKNGTVTNSERRISRQRPFMPAPGEARGDWWIISQLAQRLGYGDAFRWPHPHAVFCEHAALSGYENDGARAFDISGLAALSREEYDALEPVQWPVNAGSPCGTTRLLAQGSGWRQEGKLHMAAVKPQLPQARVNAHYPLLLNTGRIRDQWHTMTRTGYVPRLMQHIPLPQLDIHPDDATRYGLIAGALARVHSPLGWMVARVNLTTAQRPGTLFAPMHWNDCFARQGRVNALVAPVVDPHSGQPESKQTAVRVEGWRAAWQGEIFSREVLTLPTEMVWWRQAAGALQHYLFATDSQAPEWAAGLCRVRGWQVQYARGERFAHFLAWREGELQLAFFGGETAPKIQREALLAAFVTPPADAQARHALLGANAPGNQAQAGRTVCSCFSVGENSIRAAIADGCASAAALGEKLRCGTNCGSCVPELKALLAEAAHQPGGGERVPLKLL